jgi:hypothetical protein
MIPAKAKNFGARFAAGNDSAVMPSQGEQVEGIGHG